MLDIKEHEEGSVDEPTAPVQPEQGNLEIAMNQIAKRVPQLIFLATIVVASVDPNTISIPSHPR